MGSHPSPFLSPVPYPSQPKDELRRQFVGQQLKDLPAPMAILDAAVVRRNCSLMLDAVEKLGVKWRAAVKTHKTVEMAKLQVGEGPLPVRLVASTVAEIELLFPWLEECRQSGREVNALYGFPVTPSAIPRLEMMAQRLGEGTIGLFVDHPDHVRLIEQLATDRWPGKVNVFVNIDVGYGREGVPAESKQLSDIAIALSKSKKACLSGMYTHLGQSYAGESPEDGLANLCTELEGLRDGAQAFLNATVNHAEYASEKLTLSVGATPTATSAQNLIVDSSDPLHAKYKDLLDSLKESFEVELHAGVYPVLDMQQLAARARPSHSQANPAESLLDYPGLALRVLADVSSVYLDRDANKPEALIAAGSLVFGREPCKSYPGMGVVTPWPAPLSAPHYDPEGKRSGWIVGRISQEHGILTWEGPREGGFRELKVGEKIMVWPNHACIAAANFGWFAIVDSDTGDEEVVRDIWVRCRGW